jgi:hypothetical protein
LLKAGEMTMLSGLMMSRLFLFTGIQAAKERATGGASKPGKADVLTLAVECEWRKSFGIIGVATTGVAFQAGISKSILRGAQFCGMKYP